jgi:endoglucanase
MILRKKIFIIVLIFSIGILFTVGNFIVNQQNSKAIIKMLWDNYKKEYVDQTSFRVVDKQKNGITTSEGQSYGMLMSMWMDDRSSFDGIWKWTQDNLQKPNTNSFSWLWGKNINGEYKVLSEQGGDNVATDGDIDIAFALIKASQKWGNQLYLESAKLIMKDIWTNEVIITKNGKYLLVSNDLEKKYNKQEVLVNPSYFNPAAFHEFARVSSEDNWNRLSTDSYEFLEKSSQSILDSDGKSSLLPPDWMLVNIEDSSIKPTGNKDFSSRYSFDAARIPWRVALDYQLNKTKEALDYLEKFNFLAKEWNSKNLIYADYNHDGTVNGKYESKFMYATSLGYFINYDQTIADKIVQQKLSPPQLFNETMSYYDSSWVFFGLALYYENLT